MTLAALNPNTKQDVSTIYSLMLSTIIFFCFSHFFTRNSLVRKIKPVFIFCCCSNIKSERQTQSRPPRVTVATICSSAAENGEARSRSFSPCCWSSSFSFSSSSLLLVLQKEEAGQMDAKAPLGSSWWVRASWRLI